MEISWKTAQQFGFFSFVGVINTAMDVTVFNLLASKPLAWRRIPASFVSTSVGMAFGFTMNLLFVFQPDRNDFLLIIARYLVVTSFSAYAIQSTVLYFGVPLGRKVSEIVRNNFRLFGEYNLAYLQRNLVKVLAIMLGMVWNFAFYKYFVYANH